MLKVEPGKSVEYGGALMDITADVLRIIRDIHSGIKQSDPKAAHLFRVCIVAQVFDPDSIVWDGKTEDGTTIISGVVRADDAGGAK